MCTVLRLFDRPQQQTRDFPGTIDGDRRPMQQNSRLQANFANLSSALIASKDRKSRFLPVTVEPGIMYYRVFPPRPAQDADSSAGSFDPAPDDLLTGHFWASLFARWLKIAKLPADAPGKAAQPDEN